MSQTDPVLEVPATTPPAQAAATTPQTTPPVSPPAPVSPAGETKPAAPLLANKYPSRAELNKGIYEASKATSIDVGNVDGWTDAAAELLYRNLQHKISKGKAPEAATPPAPVTPPVATPPATDPAALAPAVLEIKDDDKNKLASGRLSAEKVEGVLKQLGLDPAIIIAHYEKNGTLPEVVYERAKTAFGWDKDTTILHADYAAKDVQSKQAAKQAATVQRQMENTEKVAPIFGGVEKMKEAFKQADTWLTAAEKKLIAPGIESDDVEVRVVAARQLAGLLQSKGREGVGTSITATPHAAASSVTDYSDQAVNEYRRRMAERTLPAHEIPKALEAMKMNAQGKFRK